MCVSVYVYKCVCVCVCVCVDFNGELGQGLLSGVHLCFPCWLKSWVDSSIEGI